MSSRDLDWTGVCVSLQLSAWPSSFVVLVCPKLPRYSRVPSAIGGPTLRSLGVFRLCEGRPHSVYMSIQLQKRRGYRNVRSQLYPSIPKKRRLQTFSHTQIQILYKKARLKCFMWMLHFTHFSTRCRMPTSLTCVSVWNSKAEVVMPSIGSSNVDRLEHRLTFDLVVQMLIAQCTFVVVCSYFLVLFFIICFIL